MTPKVEQAKSFKGFEKFVNPMNLITENKNEKVSYKEGGTDFGFQEKNLFKNCDKLESSTTSRNYV